MFVIKNEFYTKLQVYRRYYDLQGPPWSKIMTCPLLQSGRVTRMIEPKIDRKIVRDLITKWGQEATLRRLMYESYVVFRAGSYPFMAHIYAITVQDD